MIKLEMTAVGLKCIFNGGGGCLTKQQMFDLIGTKSQSFNLQKRKFDLLFLIKCLACKCIMVLIYYSPFFFVHSGFVLGDICLVFTTPTF